MRLLQEFKSFAMRGNVVDLAVGIIIGGAFGKIVASLVGDVVMPPLGFLIGGVDFSSLKIVIKEAVENTPAVAIKYGVFINVVIEFIIVAFAVFIIVKAMSKIKKEVPALATQKDCPDCLMSVPIAAKRCGHCCQPLSA